MMAIQLQKCQWNTKTTQKALPSFKSYQKHRTIGIVSSSQDTDAVISGEWPAGTSLSDYEQCHMYYNDRILKQGISAELELKDIMTMNVKTVTSDQELSDVMALFDKYTGLPVVNDEGEVIGVVSRKDIVTSTGPISNFMSDKPITTEPSETVASAACQMLRHKIHRLPVVDDGKLVGIVTRTDVLQSLEVQSELSGGWLKVK